MVEYADGDTQGAENRSLDIWLDSTLQSVDEAEAKVLETAARSGLEEDDLHRVGMAVREAMVNAVVHGNRYNANKKVRLEIDTAGGSLRIRITDQGEGFDPSSVADPLAEENLLRQSGRGLLLIRAFVDEFEIRRAENAGMQFILVKHLGRNERPQAS